LRKSILMLSIFQFERLSLIILKYSVRLKKKIVLILESIVLKYIMWQIQNR